MEALLKSPETWHVVVTNENIEILKKWRGSSFNYLQIGYVVGMNKWEDGRITKEHNEYADEDFGQEITTADFKRLVLGERNYEDYGVRESEELSNYLKTKNYLLNGKLHNTLYFFTGKGWTCEYPEKSKRQTLPLTEYLKLLPTETMEKKYEYKIKDEKYIREINQITDNEFLMIDTLDSRSLRIIDKLKNTSALDIFFDKVEVVELPIINGKELTYNGFDWFNIDGFEIKKYFIINKGIQSFTLSNGTEVTEDHVNQIRKYLNK